MKTFADGCTFYLFYDQKSQDNWENLAQRVISTKKSSVSQLVREEEPIQGQTKLFELGILSLQDQLS